MADTYRSTALMGRRTLVTPQDWDDSEYSQDVTINGKVITVAEFRRRKRRKPKPRRATEVRKKST